jgi:IclR family mhp operon transcriptional activator
MADYTQVRALLRGLDVLRALNRHNGGTVLDLVAETGLPRATIYRLLETLATGGYVAKDGAGNRYRLTLQVRALADGFNDEAWVTQVATPLIEALYLDIVWPTAVATFAGTSMVVRFSTDQKSPLAIERSPVGYRVPILTTAVGLAYLAYCGDTERRAILETLARGAEAGDAKLARNEAAVEHLLAETRSRGYGTRFRGANPKTSSIAVPVLRGGHALASINITWIDSALTIVDVVERYLPALRRTARAIEERLDAPDEAAG